MRKYLTAENRILKAQIKIPMRLTDVERITLAEIAHRLGCKALEVVANVMKPDTIILERAVDRFVNALTL